MRRLSALVTLVVVLIHSPIAARADVVLDWNAIAVSTSSVRARVRSRKHAIWRSCNWPCSRRSTRLRATTSLTSEPSSRRRAPPPRLRRLQPRTGCSRTTFRSRPISIRRTRCRWQGFPTALRKSGGIATGDSAAAKMIALRVGDGSAPAQFYLPTSVDPGVWQLTPSCPAGGGVNFQWQNITPFGVPSPPASHAWIAQFNQGPPPALTSRRYARDYNEVKRVGNVSSSLTDRPQDRADVARFYAASSPAFVFNLAARQAAAAEGSSISENARVLALLNMASSDSLVASFWMKYRYRLWRPETAIHEGDLDGNARTSADATFAPYIPTPCFPSYPSNHASGSNAAAEVPDAGLRRHGSCDHHGKRRCS